MPGGRQNIHLSDVRLQPAILVREFSNHGPLLFVSFAELTFSAVEDRLQVPEISLQFVTTLLAFGSGLSQLSAQSVSILFDFLEKKNGSDRLICVRI